jgi:hypothetical protein
VTAAEAGAAAVILKRVSAGGDIIIQTGGSAEAREPSLPWLDLPDDPEAVFALLSWRARLAPLAGRENDKASLLQWARQGRNARIRLMTGPAGVGKSRLAAEVAEDLRAEGWAAGFVRPEDPVVVPLRRAGLFLVVDYPEEHPQDVRALLREVASREPRGVPVRVLLLSRQGGDRWFDLIEGAHAYELMDAQEVGLSGLAVTEPEHVFSEALCRLSAYYGRTMPVVPGDAVRNWVALDLPIHGLPLLLTAAAIHAFLNPNTALGLGGPSVVQALAKRERARLNRAGLAVGLGAKAASRVVALAAVTGAIDAPMLRRLSDPTLEIGLPPLDRVIDAVNWLPWWENNHVRSPEPDLMAAALLVRILSERPDKAPDWLWAVMEPAVTPHLVDRLGRLAFDAMTVAGSTSSITRYLSEIVRNNYSRAQKLELFSYERNRPIGLARFSADVTQALLAASTEKTDRAGLLNNLSLCLGEADDGVGALAAVREAVDIYRRLAQRNPTRFAPDLATSLSNLSGRLSEADDSKGALAAIREAVDIYRRLAQHNPTHFAPDLARSLNNLSVYLGEADDGVGALAAIREAAGTYRNLAQDNPSRFAPELAASLNNLSNRLSDADDSKGALAAIREAVEIRRRLAQDNPARFGSSLALSLHNLSLRLGDADDSVGARTAIREAVEIRRRLARDNPARFAPDLEASLKVLELLEPG